MRYAVHIGVFIAKEMRRIMLRTKHRLLRSIAAFTAAGFLLTSTVGEAAKEPIRNAFYSGVEVLLDKQKTEPATSTTPLSFVQQGKNGAQSTPQENSSFRRSTMSSPPIHRAMSLRAKAKNGAFSAIRASSSSP